MAPRAYRSGLVVKLGGLNPVHVDLYSVKESESKGGFRTVCIGDTGTPHDPTLIKQVNTCPECHSETGFVKGREVDGEIVVIDPDALKGTAADEDVKQQMVCTAHPLVDVLLSTVPGNMLYYVTPSKAKSVKGFKQSELDENFALLSLLVHANPDKAIVTVFAPSSKPSMFRFAPFGDKLTLSQLEWPESLREAPELPEVEVDQEWVDLAPNYPVQAFDPTLYRDEQKAARDDLVAAALRGDVTVTAPSSAPAPAASGPSPLDKFKSLLAAEAAPEKKPARKKATPKTDAA